MIQYQVNTGQVYQLKLLIYKGQLTVCMGEQYVKIYLIDHQFLNPEYILMTTSSLIFTLPQ